MATDFASRFVSFTPPATATPQCDAHATAVAVAQEEAVADRDFPTITCKLCAKTEKVPFDIEEFGVCSGCYLVEHRKKTMKECRICGDLRLPKDSKETHCDECKQDLQGGRVKDEFPETQISPPPKEIIYAKATATTGATYALVGRCAADIEPEPLEWLWPGRIPKSKVTLFGGRPGSGKSFVAIDVAARISSGADWPDGSKNTLGPQKVLYFATEDGAANTLVPRLMAADAVRSNIHFPETIVKFDPNTSKQQRLLISLKQHLHLLEVSLKKHPDVAMVVLDPLTSFLGVNINKDEEARPLMDQLAKTFESSGATFVAIIHHNKRSDVSALEKILGSSAIVGSARAIWDFSRDPDSREERHMSLVKLNIAEEPGGMKYTIKTKDLGRGLKPGYVEWMGQTDENADDLLNRQREASKGKREAPALTAAKLFLQTALQGGAAKSSGDNGLLAQGEREGINPQSLWRAKKELGIIHTRQGKEYYWSLPVKNVLMEDVEVM